MTHRTELIHRAKLIGAYRRRDDLQSRGLPVDDAEQRIADLEANATPALMAEARRLAEPSHRPAI